MTTTAAVTYFCGDPFITFFWMKMYQRYWRGEVDKLYACISYNKDNISEQAISAQRSLFATFPEVVLREEFGPIVPELANSKLLQEVQEDIVFLIETDSFIFRPDFVKSYMIEPISIDGYDIVGSNYRLISPEVSPKNPLLGFMRNVFSCRTDLLKQTDLNFYPYRLIRGQETNGFKAPRQEDFDCFGWMSYQLLTLAKNIKVLPYANTINSYREMMTETNFNQYPFVHVRQFNSSFLGMTTPTWNKIRDNDLEYLRTLYAGLIPGSPNMWYFEKAVAFRFIFLKYLKDELSDFANEYKDVLEKTIQITGANINNINHIADMFDKKFDIGGIL